MVQWAEDITPCKDFLNNVHFFFIIFSVTDVTAWFAIGMGWWHNQWFKKSTLCQFKYPWAYQRHWRKYYGKCVLNLYAQLHCIASGFEDLVIFCLLHSTSTMDFRAWYLMFKFKFRPYRYDIKQGRFLLIYALNSNITC